ncbi:MAG TPA: DUF397 domain-containing protein [Streptosporangiaceae bacterium]|nr:DUF397 domain-containing protein [Streptosporangiaceae bacterium]
MNLSTAGVPPGAWRKSSYSGGSGSSNCVEVAGTPPGAVAVRDSKNPAVGAVTIDDPAWRSLLAAIKRGRHDL